ncbi:hypothetical protein INT45_000186 [Circinella minor]|uniref:Uncharacterized protein n=1 Tax=Circinella minor TaxID=1195481 RepID=A0A8H7S7P4_9FUNG|nr:hypothetical protein INT45_000186 [Circinella minor]
MKGRYVVMVNTPIHVKQRGQKCTYLAQHSPFLNSIEKFWPKVNLNARRGKLIEKYQLIPSITEAASKRNT